MKRIILVAFLTASPATAFAQTPAQPDPNTTALGQMVIEAAQREAGIRAQLIAAQAHVAELEKEKAKPATPAPAPAEPSPPATKSP